METGVGAMNNSNTNISSSECTTHAPDTPTTTPATCATTPATSCQEQQGPLFVPSGPLLSALLQGVSLRLESPLLPVRRQGMRVGRYVQGGVLWVMMHHDRLVSGMKHVFVCTVCMHYLYAHVYAQVYAYAHLLPHRVLSLLLDAKGPPLFNDQGPLDWLPEELWGASCAAALGAPPADGGGGPCASTHPTPPHHPTNTSTPRQSMHAATHKHRRPDGGGAQNVHNAKRGALGSTGPPLGPPTQGTLLGVGDEDSSSVPGGLRQGDDEDEGVDEGGDVGDVVQRVMRAAYGAMQGRDGGGVHASGVLDAADDDSTAQHKTQQQHVQYVDSIHDGQHNGQHDDDVISIMDSDDDTESSVMEGFDLEEHLDLFTGALTAMLTMC